MTTKKKTSKAQQNDKDFNYQPPVVQSASVPKGFAVSRTITVPALSMKEVDKGFALRFDSPFRVSTVVKLDKDGKPEKPATICNVTDVQSGEQFILMVSAVVHANLNGQYPDDTYVAKTFWIMNKGKSKVGQRYNNFEIHELEKTA